MADWLHGHLYEKSCLTVVEDCEDDGDDDDIDIHFGFDSSPYLHLDLAINMLG
jgi:hypothetical protein